MADMLPYSLSVEAVFILISCDAYTHCPCYVRYILQSIYTVPDLSNLLTYLSTYTSVRNITPSNTYLSRENGSCERVVMVLKLDWDDDC